MSLRAEDAGIGAPFRCAFGLTPEDLRVGAGSPLANRGASGALPLFAADAALLRAPADFASTALSAFRAARDLPAGDFSCFVVAPVFFTDFFATAGVTGSGFARSLVEVFDFAGAITADGAAVFLAFVIESVVAFRLVVFATAVEALTVAGSRALLDGVLAILVAAFCVADFCTVADFFVVNL